MAEEKTSPLSRIVFGWVGTLLFAAIIAYSLIDGDVALGRHSRIHFLRAKDPLAYWLTESFYIVLLGCSVYYLARVKRAVAAKPVEPDPTPRDWMGNPVEKK